MIAIIFSGERIYATYYVVSVHKTHLKFSRRNREVPVPVSVDSAGRVAPMVGAAGVVIGNIYRILQ